MNDYYIFNKAAKEISNGGSRYPVSPELCERWEDGQRVKENIDFVIELDMFDEEDVKKAFPITELSHD